MHPSPPVHHPINIQAIVKHGTNCANNLTVLDCAEVSASFQANITLSYRVITMVRTVDVDREMYGSSAVLT